MKIENESPFSPPDRLQRLVGEVVRFTEKRLDVLALISFPTNGGNIMETTVKRATICLDEVVHKALKIKSIETSRSISDLVNSAVKTSLAEDAEDLAAFGNRAKEPLLSYDEMVKRFKTNGRL